MVAGIRTPQPLEEMSTKWPDVYDELYKYEEQLEKYYSDTQVGEEIDGSQDVSVKEIFDSKFAAASNKCLHCTKYFLQYARYRY